MHLGPTNQDFCVDCGMGPGAHIAGHCPPYVIQQHEHSSGDPWGIWPLVIAVVVVALVAGAVLEGLR